MDFLTNLLELCHFFRSRILREVFVLVPDDTLEFNVIIKNHPQSETECDKRNYYKHVSLRKISKGGCSE